MRPTVIAAAALGLALIGLSPAVAESPATPAATATQAANTDAKPADPMDQIVCKHEKEIGSLLPGKRVCRTRRDWDAMARDAQDFTSRQQMQGTVPMGAGSGH